MRAAALAGRCPRPSTRTRRRRSRTCRTASRAAAAWPSGRGKAAPRAAARRRGAGAAPAGTTTPTGRRGVGRRAVAGGAWRAALGDARDARPRGPRPPSAPRAAAGRRRGHLRPRGGSWPRPTCSSPRGRGARAAGAAALRARQDRRTGRRHGCRGPLAGACARAALCHVKRRCPAVDATSRRRPPRRPAGPRGPRAAGARGAGVVQGRHARFCDKAPPRRLPAVLRRRPRGRPRRPVRRGSRKSSTGGPPSRRSCGAARRGVRPRSAPRPSPPRRALAAPAPRPPRAGPRAAARWPSPRRATTRTSSRRPGPRRPARRDCRPDGGGRAVDRVARAVRFGAGEDAAPALDFGGSGPVRPDRDVSRAPRGRGRRRV